ncbi:helix-turn-helix transcriptional regulator [Pararcticibacter amylolyticus]|uniref:HTH luxR-type domain-containing protein n=1 Tax=Pararcticibacter amylolyticus TaxID=2173175 RepID=A0A2U2PL96_9SPHI|nr:hypothetical protein [Pararcticibacter amylolyticus]PWG82054.1 hypothetical protein DDR33_03270 [Pararcticibacter amylolyticus]
MEERMIELLFEGKTQAEIADILKIEGYKPNCLSSIEKLLKKVRAKHGANTMFHLGVILARTVAKGKKQSKQSL